MNFRLVWVGADDEPLGRQPSVEGEIPAVRRFLSTPPRYERQGTEMVRLRAVGKWRNQTNRRG